MKLRALARKRRRVEGDGDEKDADATPPHEQRGASRHPNSGTSTPKSSRPRPKSPLKNVFPAQNDEHDLSAAVPRPEYDSWTTGSDETILPTTQDSLETVEGRSQYVPLANEQSFELKNEGSQYIPLPREEEAEGFNRPPLSGFDLDRLNYHIDLQEFATSLQKASNAVFASDRRSRYTQVSVLLLSWADEDPKLPVSIEIEELKDVFLRLYGFDVAEWQIPAINSHGALNRKILDFLSDSGTRHLKIVYYAGHGKLSNHGQAIWTSHRNKSKERPPTVKWSGIQNALEESESDVLILLDCCASGLSNTDEGNGVTELLAACAFNGIANGVGPYSFTHALISQLRKLARMTSFSVGYLYNLLFTEIQSLRIDDAQRKKAPIHLVLTQDNRLPRSIQISHRSPPLFRDPPLGSSMGRQAPSDEEQLKAETDSSLQTTPFSATSSVFSPDINDAESTSSSSSISQLPEYPRLLFSIRISEDIKPSELSLEMFADWLGTLPMKTRYVRVEAGFASDSTILVISMPAALLAYLPDNPAITMLGTTRSTNLLLRNENMIPTLSNIATVKDHLALDRQTETQDSGFVEASMSYPESVIYSPQDLDVSQTPGKGKSAPLVRCNSCNRAETPEWRRGSDEAPTLCNSCGLLYAKSSRKTSQDHIPKCSTPLRQTHFLPVPDISSPTVKRTLFPTPITKFTMHADRVISAEKERKEKEKANDGGDNEFDDLDDSPKKGKSFKAIQDSIAKLLSSEPKDSLKLESILAILAAARWTGDECRIVRHLALEKSPTPPTLELDVKSQEDTQNLLSLDE